MADKLSQPYSLIITENQKIFKIKFNILRFVAALIREFFHLMPYHIGSVRKVAAFQNFSSYAVSFPYSLIITEKENFFKTFLY